METEVVRFGFTRRPMPDREILRAISPAPALADPWSAAPDLE